LGEYPKASERRILKELGKKTTRNFGRWVPQAVYMLVAQRKFVSRLFIKNTGPCKSFKLKYTG